MFHTSGFVLFDKTKTDTLMTGEGIFGRRRRRHGAGMTALHRGLLHKQNHKSPPVRAIRIIRVRRLGLGLGLAGVRDRLN